MRCGLLASLVVLGVVGLAQADYVVIIANLNPKADTPRTGIGPPMGGGFAAAGGMGGGFPPQGGMGGGFPPAGGMAGGMAGGFANRGGFPAAGAGGFQAGGFPQGGMANRGGFQVGGMPAVVVPPINPEAADDANLIVAIVEVTGPSGGYRKTFKLGGAPRFKHRWGQAVLYAKPQRGDYEAHILETPDGAILKSRSDLFKAKHEKWTKEKTPSNDGIELAKWALAHGLIDEFVKVMDKLAETEKTNTAVAAYLKVKADLAKPVAKEDLTDKWKSRLDGYLTTQTEEHHYALLHGGETGTSAKVQLDLLERNFRSWFYWWAMRGITIPVPTKRLLAIYTDKGDDFSRLRKNLTSSPAVADSFFARREGLSVFAGKRGDRPYNTLEGMTKASLWDKGFVREKLITGLPKQGYPRNVDQQDVQRARAWALVQTAMEYEWEKTNTSHESSRQLLYATGMLPGNVNVPEWIQFGMGSFFEAPLQSPWAGVGALSPYWLPRFKEAQTKSKYESSALATLQKVITDGYFRGKMPLPDKATPEQRDARSQEQRRARAASWALTYYLAQTQIEGLRRYFKELSRMPRDIELDDKVLIAAFARAFDCVDSSKKVDQAKLSALATRWVNYITSQALEADSIHKKVREFYEKVAKSKAQPVMDPRMGFPPGGNPPNIPPGLPRPPG